MKKILIFGMFLIAAISCNKEVDFKPQDINFDRDACHVCKMGLTDQRFNVQAINEYGEVHFYDDLGCLAEEMRDTEWNKWKGNKVKFWIGDYNAGNVKTNWIDAEKAFYTYGIHTPMDYGYTAHTNKPKDKNIFSFTETLKRINEGKTKRENYIQEKKLMMKESVSKEEIKK
jgi:copper chaperone NosL